MRKLIDIDTLTEALVTTEMPLSESNFDLMRPPALISTENKVAIGLTAIGVVVLSTILYGSYKHSEGIKGDKAQQQQMLIAASSELGIPKDLLEKELNRLCWRYDRYLKDKEADRLSDDVMYEQTDRKFKSALIMALVSLKRTVIVLENHGVSYVWDYKVSKWKKEGIDTLAFPDRGTPFTKLAHDNDTDINRTTYPIATKDPETIEDLKLSKAINNIRTAKEFSIHINEVVSFSKQDTPEMNLSGEGPHPNAWTDKVSLSGKTPRKLGIENQHDMLQDVYKPTHPKK